MLHKIRNWISWALPLACAILVGGSGAQSSIPTVDLSVGPLVTTNQAVNVALALSVEFPTAGAAYRTGLTYSTGTVYIGYWDSNSCYQYFDETDKSATAGQYFWRSGAVDTNGYCNTSGAGTGYSGNTLNWAATSSIDNLRLALTGGNRILDTAGATVLGRAYLPSQFNDGGYGEGTGGYWPPKQVPPSLVGLVTPAFTTPGASSAYTGTVFIKGCQDRIFVGNTGSGGSCASPGNANIFSPFTPSLGGSFTTLGFIVNPVDTATTTYVVTSPAQGYWGRNPSNGTTTILPIGVDPVAGVLVPEAVSPSPRNSTVISTGNTPQYAGDSVTTVTWTVNTGTSTTAPTSQVVAGTSTTPPTVVLGTAWVQTGAQALLVELPVGAPVVIAATGVTRLVCRNAGINVRLAANGACTAPLSQQSVSGLTTYFQYTNATVYRTHTSTPIYTYYQTYPAWYIPAVYTVYNVYNNSAAPTRMNAAVKVCDSAEATTRQISTGQFLCQKYPSGSYKPVGQLQINSKAVRASAFGYLIDNVTSRYGGVLRAPMKFVGPTYKDTAGILQTNTNPEWDATTGVFAADPLGASPSFPNSGVINYLNKFGSDGSYKGYDPLGELWYEALRYFQGLSPTPSATSSMTTAMMAGFPVYTPSTSPAWVDPIQNGCQRSNFILTIGDVNTWYDKQLPGLNSLADSTDAARAAVTIPGTSATFDATYWTSLLSAFETGASVTYTDALGRKQNTAGNPSTNSSNNNLEGKTTGAGSSSAYYWAGSAYWANTQSIRQSIVTDPVSSKTQTTANIRVRSYTIDVDEGGNGLIDGNTRPIQPRQSSFYLAGKYGWFKDINKDGSPFGPTVNGLREWEDPTTPNTPDGYTLASQAQRMIAGIQKFFAAAVTTGGSLSVSALSSQRYSATSQTGDIFTSAFDSSSWSGTLYKRSVFFNTTTFQLQLFSGNAWDAGQVLTSASISTSSTFSDPYVAPANRNIWTFRRVLSGQSTIPFTTASLASALLDPGMSTALSVNPATGLADGRASDRIDYLRGNRSQETGVTNPFRLRTSIMGDVINSGPAYKGGADTSLAGPSYSTFVTAQSGRTPMVYVGANDGMLHAFRASDSKEIFAYVPLAVRANLAKLTNPNYLHVPFVDGVPGVGEAQVNGAWRTVLAGGMGGGAKGVYALDVTFPESFGASSTNSSSSALWEFTNQDDSMMGNVLSEPAIVKINTSGPTSSPNYKWFVAVNSGYNNYANDGTGNFSTSGDQAMFLLSLDRQPTDTWQSGVNYFRIPVSIGSTSRANGLAAPSPVIGLAGETIAMYAGDLQGRMWKFDFSFGLSSALISSGTIVKSSGGVQVPIFTTATDSTGTAQPITVAPQVTYANAGGYMVTFGTGKFMEQTDNNTISPQAVYSIWDPNTGPVTSYPGSTTNLFQQTLIVGSTTITTGTGSFVLGVNSGQKRGCYFNLTQTGERIGVQGDQGGGSVAFNSLIPLGTSCTGDGYSLAYQIKPSTCALVNSTATQSSSSGFFSKPNFIQIDFSPSGATSNYTSRRLSGVRKFSDYSTPISARGDGTLNQGGGIGGIPTPPPPINAGRVSWRELKSVN